MNVNFYQFSKRENSTAQPGSGTPAQTFDCKLKNDTSIISPIIELMKPSNISWSTILGFNYCYISDFSRYYFVQDLTFKTNSIVEIQLTVDVLASFKLTIGSASEYVLRAASDYNTNILDSLYPLNAEVSFAYGAFTGTTIPTEWLPWDIYGTYVIGIINNTSTIKNGAVTYYMIPYYVMNNVMSFLLGSPSYMNIQTSEISQELTKALVNPIQYITEAYYIPYDITSIYQPENLAMGWWPLPVVGDNYVATPFDNNAAAFWTVGTAKTRLDLPIHPESSNRGRYLRCNPWSRYMLYAGPFGNIPLDPGLLTKTDYIQLTVQGNGFGDVRLLIYDQYDNLIGKYTANVKQTLCVGQVNNDPLAFQKGLLSLAGTVAGGAANPVGAIVSGMTGIMDNSRNLYPQVQTTGSMNSAFENGTPFQLVAEFHGVADDDPTHRGRPLCEVKTINTLSGFILVADPDIAISGTAEENNKVKSYMSEGFYYE